MNRQFSNPDAATAISDGHHPVAGEHHYVDPNDDGWHA
jgi:hypothetical protein